MGLTLIKNLFYSIIIAGILFFIGYFSMINPLRNSLKELQHTEITLAKQLTELHKQETHKNNSALSKTIKDADLLVNFLQLAKSQRIAVVSTKPLSLHALQFVIVGYYNSITKFFVDLGNYYPTLDFADFSMEKFSPNKDYLSSSATIEI